MSQRRIVSFRRRSARLGALALCSWVLCAAVSTAAQGQGLDQLPRYRPEQQVSGTIRLWGHGSFKADFMGRLVRTWAQGFGRYQPRVKLENYMYGTASAIGALSVGPGDVALLGEEISPAASAAFQRAKHYPPLGIEVATGSLDTAFFDYAHVVFVNKDNPIARLTLRQLDAVFGAEHRRGPRNIRRWGELGLTGEWANARIQPYSWRDLDFSLFIQGAVLGGSHRWNDEVKDFGHLRRPDGSVADPGKQILDALAGDRFGIAISNWRYANPRVKAIALAAADGGPYYDATKANLISQRYPLTRIVPAFIDRPPGRPVDPKVREFLRYILSREGQEAITRESGYLQLSAAAVREQRRKLEGGTGSPVRHGAAEPVASTIRIWSNGAMRDVVTRWQAGFERKHPGTKVVGKPIGTDLAMAALYTRHADIALMGREPTASEVQAFEWIYRCKPTRLEIMSGSLGGAEKSPALAVFVHRENPLARLTLTQLRRVFGYTNGGRLKNIRTWGRLGLGGDWAARPIDLYGPDATSGTGAFLRHTLLHDSRWMNWERMHEYSDPKRIVDALAHDRFGIAIANVGFVRGETKLLPLAVEERGPFLEPTVETIRSRRYPLTRRAYALVRRVPGHPLDRRVEAFLRYVLSSEGQAQIDRAGGYVRLPADAVRAQMKILQ